MKTLFTRGDATVCAKNGQDVPTGYYDLERSTLDELTDWTVWADKVLVF